MKHPKHCPDCLPLPQQSCNDCEWDESLERPDGYIAKSTWRPPKRWKVVDRRGWILGEYDDLDEAWNIVERLSKGGKNFFVKED